MVEFALKVTIVIFITEIIIAPVTIFTDYRGGRLGCLNSGYGAASGQDLLRSSRRLADHRQRDHQPSPMHLLQYEPLLVVLILRDASAEVAVVC